MASISCQHIYKIYPGATAPSVTDFNLEIKDKEFIIFVGPSGCGKSTTLRMIAGLEEISKGEMYIGGRLINDVPPKDRDIAMVFQSYALYPHMTVYKNIAFGLELRKTPKDEIDKRVHEAAKILEIEHLLDRKPKALSGGQRQRVALGRAMVRNPAVFLLDEPLSNLDAKLRTSMRTEIIKLHKKLATTFIYVTHDQTEAMTMGDRIVVMKDGIIQQVDTPQNLYDYPCNMFVAGFIGSPQMNFLDGSLTKKGDQYAVDLGGDLIPLPKEKTADGKLDAYVGKKVKMGIRPEDIDDEPEFMAKHPDCQLNAEVEVSEMMGAEIYLYLDYKGNKMTARVAPTSKARNERCGRLTADVCRKAVEILKEKVDTTKFKIFGIISLILAGIGAVATTAERSKDLLDEMVEKGELTVEQGKVLNEELKHNIKQKVQDVTGKKEAELSDEDISDLIDRMTPEQIRALKEKLAGSDDAQTESEEEAAEEEKAE